MNRPYQPLLVLLFAAPCASLAFAQDAQKPAAAPAAEAQKPRPVGQPADPRIIEKIFTCLAPGLPKDWKKTWFVVNEVGRDKAGTTRNFEANFFFATSIKDHKGQKLKPCGADPVLDGVRSLQDYLPENQLRWTGATFTFSRETGGVKFDATYDYTPHKPAPAAAKKSDASSK
jgi:hypothetical protein